MSKHQKEIYKKFEEDLIFAINNTGFSNPVILIYPSTLIAFYNYCIDQLNPEARFKLYNLPKDRIKKHKNVPFKIDSTIDSESFKIINDINE